MKTFAITALSLLTPALALAQSVNTSVGIGKLLNTILGLINFAVPVVIALAVLYFFWGLAQYILEGAGEGKDKGKEMMIWGIIALFVMVSVWGFINLLQTTFGVGGQGPIIPRPIQGQGGASQQQNSWSGGYDI